jgi:hypothetical protein
MTYYEIAMDAHGCIDLRTGQAGDRTRPAVCGISRSRSQLRTCAGQASSGGWRNTLSRENSKNIPTGANPFNACYVDLLRHTQFNQTRRTTRTISGWTQPL